MNYTKVLDSLLSNDIKRFQKKYKKYFYETKLTWPLMFKMAYCLEYKLFTRHEIRMFLEYIFTEELKFYEKLNK